PLGGVRLNFTSIKKRILIRIFLSIVCMLIISNFLGNLIPNMFFKLLLDLVLVGAYLKLVERFFHKGILKPIYLINKV
ncbi:MAG TPA: hypothetical protein DEB05_02565, partial [Firmicutes bacterium]|nr:hypothetical protein [Bacillota bacterium]